MCEAVQRKLKSPWHDPDDRVGLAANGDVSPDDFRVTSEATLPESLAEDGYVWRSGPIVVGRKSPPKHWPGPKRIKIIPTDSSTLHERGRPITSEIEIILMRLGRSEEHTSE